MTLTVTILGCGASPGVPRIGNDWGDCDPSEAKNRRRRCAILIDKCATDGSATRVLVDCGPDIREQLLDASVERVDAVVFTHSHADHTHGIDDLRAFWISNHERVEVFADGPTLERLRQAFGYCFETPAGSSYPPILNANLVNAGETLTVTGAGGPLDLNLFRMTHGDIDCLGIRTGGFAYSSEFSDLPEESLSAVSDLDIWLIGALRRKPHPSHQTLDQALGWIARMNPRRAILTHMHTDMDYATLTAELPAGVEPGYDMMVVQPS